MRRATIARRLDTRTKIQFDEVPEVPDTGFSWAEEVIGAGVGMGSFMIRKIRSDRRVPFAAVKFYELRDNLRQREVGIVAIRPRVVAKARAEAEHQVVLGLTSDA